MPLANIDDALANEFIAEALRRGVIRVTERRVTYHLNQQKTYDWNDPEEWVRAATIGWLIIARDYPAVRIRTEVSVPRRVPGDFADVVVYRDDACRDPYLVIENKAAGQSTRARSQAVEQLFGNANSLRAPFGLYEEHDTSVFFDIAGFEPTERTANRLGTRNAVPRQYGEVAQFTHIAGHEDDIQPMASGPLGARIRRAHYAIWAGGRRDPLTAFDEWSKLLFAKVVDERLTPTGQPRRFQFGNRETTAAVANRVHELFTQATRQDPTIFPVGTRINLPETKIAEVVRILQGVCFVRTDVDSVGRAFEEFFGSVFRGELGQYFTMRQLARFTVAVLDISAGDYVLDPTAGSGGFLLEVLLQTWHRVDRDFQGQPEANISRIKTDFALSRVYGIEIHEILARICKINLMLHHDGHTNIEADRSCLDSTFMNPRLNPPVGRFTRIVGNPPFGDEVAENDEDHLGSNRLASFTIAVGRTSVDSEQVIMERCIDLLEPGGRFGLILPDGVFNNQGHHSNCPQTRAMLAKRGRIEAIISLPDHAFKRAGAQNKTSILFFRKFTTAEKHALDRALEAEIEMDQEPAGAAVDPIGRAVVRAGLNYAVFLAEANHVGYTATGAHSPLNDLYLSSPDGVLTDDQSGTVLGEWRRFLATPDYPGSARPDCMACPFDILWTAHPSHRLDPKYHLFKREANRDVPEGWIRQTIGGVMQRQFVPMSFEVPDAVHTVLTLSQTGEIRPRVAGKGNNPPEWIGAYFAESASDWFAASEGNVVFSSIDLWKGCIAVVPAEFNGGLVTKEFPIYRITDERLSPAFLQALLRTRYYQRAFRAITTGHSNRRRTQVGDFEALEISFPPTVEEQQRLIAAIQEARERQRAAGTELRHRLLEFSDMIDGRGEEELPGIFEESED